MGATEVIRVSISPASLIGALRWLLQEFRHRVYRRVYLSYWPRLRKGWKWSRGIKVLSSFCKPFLPDNNGELSWHRVPGLASRLQVGAALVSARAFFSTPQVEI